MLRHIGTKIKLKRFNFYDDATSMVTLKHVADKAGVSLGTASAAMNGRSSVKAATRERVAQAAAELGYKKDASASVLAGKQRGAKTRQRQLTLGLVASPGMSNLEIEWTQFRQLAETLGYQVEQIWLRDYSSIRRAQEHFRFLNIQGLFLPSPGAVPGREWLEFDWGQFSVVKAFRAWPELSFPVIRHSADDYIQMARDQAIASGYRKMGFLLRSSSVLQDDESRLGSILAYKHLHPAEHLKMEWRVLQGGLTDVPEKVCRWLRTYQPEVVIGFPGALYHEMLDLGFRIPADFAYISVIESRDYYRIHGVAGCDARKEVFPEKAVQMLHRMIQVGDRGVLNEPTEVVVEPRWINGASAPKTLECSVRGNGMTEDSQTLGHHSSPSASNGLNPRA